MLKLLNIALNKISNGLYQASLKSFDYERKIGIKRIHNLENININLHKVIINNEMSIHELNKKYFSQG